MGISLSKGCKTSFLHEKSQSRDFVIEHCYKTPVIMVASKTLHSGDSLAPHTKDFETHAVSLQHNTRVLRNYKLWCPKLCYWPSSMHSGSTYT